MKGILLAIVVITAIQIFAFIVTYLFPLNNFEAIRGYASAFPIGVLCARIYKND